MLRHTNTGRLVDLETNEEKEARILRRGGKLKKRRCHLCERKSKYGPASGFGHEHGWRECNGTRICRSCVVKFYTLFSVRLTHGVDKWE